MYLGLSLKLPVRTAVATAAPTPVPTNRRLVSAGNLRTISPDVYRSVQGSGSFPVWLPTAPSGDRPTIYADFVNGNYWGNGAVTTAVALFEHNADWGDWNPACIQAGLGLSPTDLTGSNNCWAQVVSTFYGSLLTTGATFVTIGHAPDITGSGQYDFEADLWDDPGFTAQSGAFPLIYFDTNATPGNVVEFYNGLDSRVDGPTPPTVATAKVAYTVATTPTMSYSFNGASILSIASGTQPNPWTNIGLAVNVYGNLGAGYMTSIAIYAPQPDADLPTLSTP
jgi:hypothetical protein